MTHRPCHDCGSPSTLMVDFKSGPGGRDQIGICEDCALGWWEFLQSPHIYGGIVFLTAAGNPDLARPIWEPPSDAPVRRPRRRTLP